MKTLYNIALIIPTLFCISSGAQNLVTNSTFEAKRLHQNFGEIKKAHAWQNANTGSVDLFDKAKAGDAMAMTGIPYNYMGYQPSSDGQNYAGFVAYYDDDTNFPGATGYKRYTEYIEGTLREPMVAGEIYQLSFKINLADKSGRAVSGIGALITPERVQQDNNTFLKQVPQFISHRVISDSLNWVTLSGAYIASGGEKYITIGCFQDDEFTSAKVVSDLRNDSHKAYYYVAEVSVIPYSIYQPNLEPIITGVDYAELMSVQFTSNSSEITPQFYNELNQVALWMKQHPDYQFFIAGYTDQQGSSIVNDPLSLDRARNVKQYLLDKGVKKENIITDGFGSNDSIDCKTKSRKNRRVEVYLYTNEGLSKF